MKANTAIREIMTTSLVTIKPDTPINVIQDIFRENDFHHLPVLEQGAKLVGIISKEDIFKLSYVLSMQTTGRSYSVKEYQTLPARDIMTRFPLSLDPEDSIGLAADIFMANKFHALPIVEDGQLLGMVTTHDLLAFSFDKKKVEKVEEVFEE
jgi:CBS domain-containing protein